MRIQQRVSDLEAFTVLRYHEYEPRFAQAFGDIFLYGSQKTCATAPHTLVHVQVISQLDKLNGKLTSDS